MRMPKKIHWKRIILLGLPIVLIISGISIGLYAKQHHSNPASHTNKTTPGAPSIPGKSGPSAHVFPGGKRTLNVNTDIKEIGYEVPYLTFDNKLTSLAKKNTIWTTSKINVTVSDFYDASKWSNDLIQKEKKIAIPYIYSWHSFPRQNSYDNKWVCNFVFAPPITSSSQLQKGTLPINVNHIYISSTKLVDKNQNLSISFYTNNNKFVGSETLLETKT